MTTGHWAPGEGTRARRSRSKPCCAAATSPSSAAPTTAHHEPPAHGPLSKARASEVAPGKAPRPTTTVLPLRKLLPGKRSASGATSGSVRSSARTALPALPSRSPSASRAVKSHLLSIARIGNVCSRARRVTVAATAHPVGSCTEPRHAPPMAKRRACHHHGPITRTRLRAA